MTGKKGSGRTFVLSIGYAGGALAGAWLGLVVAFVSRLVSAKPPTARKAMR